MHSQATQRTSFGSSSMRTLSSEQCRRLSDLRRQFGAAAAPQDLLTKLATLIASVLQIKVAFVGHSNGMWAALAESSTGAPPSVSRRRVLEGIQPGRGVSGGRSSELGS